MRTSAAHSVFAKAVAFALLASAAGVADEWPQFRGVGASGVGAADARPPAELSIENTLAWKLALPLGRGSPSVWGDRIFVTAADRAAGKLETIAVDRTNGSVIWRREVTPDEWQENHAESSPATSTPAVDGERVYVYFGNYGLVAYGWDGEIAWERRLPLSKEAFGSGTSPVVAGDLVLVLRDYEPEPRLLAFLREDGSPGWSTDLPRATSIGPRTAHSTPVVWKDQVLLHRHGELAAYSRSDGARAWWVGLVSTGTSTPIVTEEAVYVAGFSPANGEALPEHEPFQRLLERYDSDGDGKLTADEAPVDGAFLLRRPELGNNVAGAQFTLRSHFRLVDRDGDGFVTSQEWTDIRKWIEELIGGGQPGFHRIAPGGEGDRTLEAVRWVERRNLSEVPSPLYFGGKLYAVTNGGIVSRLDGDSGRVVYRGRIGALGAYYSSPVAADGKVYLSSAEGVVTVLAAGEKLQVVSQNELGEPIYGSPALIGDAIYIRSANHLWAFRNRGDR